MSNVQILNVLKLMIRISQGGIALIWTLLWAYLVYDTPFKHPRISCEEKAYIIESIGLTEKTKEDCVSQKLEVKNRRLELVHEYIRYLSTA